MSRWQAGSLRAWIRSNLSSRATCAPRDLRRKSSTGDQQCLGRDGQRGIASGELARTGIELLPALRANDDETLLPREFSLEGAEG